VDFNTLLDHARKGFPTEINLTGVPEAIAQLNSIKFKLLRSVKSTLPTALIMGDSDEPELANLQTLRDIAGHMVAMKVFANWIVDGNERQMLLDEFDRITVYTADEYLYALSDLEDYFNEFLIAGGTVTPDKQTNKILIGFNMEEE